MRNKYHKYTAICIVICSILYGKYSLADQFFEASLIEGGMGNKKDIDLSIFDQFGGQLPGKYFTNIYVNKKLVANTNVQFDFIDGSESLAPLLTKSDYIKYGVLKSATTEFSHLSDDSVINNIATVIPDAFFKYNFEKNQLELSIPQVYLDKKILGQVPESLWDDGINALYTNYYYSGSTTKNNGQSGTTNNSYLNLRSGLNIGAWRLRNYSTYSHNATSSSWQNVSTYLERNVKALKSQLTIGDTYTNSDMFDSFSFRGIKLASDDAMLPSSQRGYAPIIRGVAQSNAEVTIKQNGIVILQSYVPAGPFEFNDFYPTSSSGDLEVTIKEANGSIRTYIQPFSSVPIMLREGNFKYSIIAGKYHSNSVSSFKEPSFIQGSAIYGLPYSSTVYGGTILSKDYKSVLFGIGKGLGEFGSLSFDASIARSTLQNNINTGSSIRFQYSKDVLITGTSFSFTSYRYSTKNYREFSDVNNYSYDEWHNNQNKKDKFQFNISQDLGKEFGGLNLVGYQERYWNRQGKVESLQFGYNNSFNGISFMANYAYSKDHSRDNDNKSFSLSVSIPLDKLFPTTNLYLASSVDGDHKRTSNIGFSGTGFNNSLNYNVQTSYANNTDSHSSASASVNYKARFGEYQVGYNYNNHTNQFNYSANGSIVAHPYGLTLGQPLGESAVLIRAKDADNIRVINNTGVYTDYFGNAIVPYSSPYEKNTISLDTNAMGKKVDLITSTKTVVPTRGAIVLADYQTQIGYKIYVKLTGADIPFGASAVVKNGDNSSSTIVDDGQVVFLSGVPEHGDIHVTWSTGQCKASYKLMNLDATVSSFSTVCK